MAPKTKTAYVCSECGYETSKWCGKCPSCNEWNTMEETIIIPNAPSARSSYSLSSSFEVKSLKDISVKDEHRITTNISELDRVLGGGIVKGSVILLSGDPGIGKSTILLHICANVSDKLNVLYVSGEESAVQLKLRAERLEVSGTNLSIMTQTDAEIVAEYIRTQKPDIVMVDSIQTMQITSLVSSPGSIVQVRECSNLLMRVAKENDIPMFIVSHVNKGGEIAGPKVMEHIVDTVLYFEGERNQAYRILRAVKNRFGSTNEIGVFEMRSNGLAEVENPSMMMLSGRASGVSGSCITCVMEGSRPILSEVQGLVAKSGFGNSRRVSTGFDNNRLNLLLAVLEKRQGMYFSNFDTYINVVGGLKLDEPAADLAVVLSLASGLRDIPIDQHTVVFGEVGLAGEVRSVPRAAQRAAEAARLGFKRCILPKYSMKQFGNDFSVEIELLPVKNIAEAISYL